MLTIFQVKETPNNLTFWANLPLAYKDSRLLDPWFRHAMKMLKDGNNEEAAQQGWTVDTYKAAQGHYGTVINFSDVQDTLVMKVNQSIDKQYDLHLKRSALTHYGWDGDINDPMTINKVGYLNAEKDVDSVFLKLLFSRLDTLSVDEEVHNMIKNYRDESVWGRGNGITIKLSLFENYYINTSSDGSSKAYNMARMYFVFDKHVLPFTTIEHIQKTYVSILKASKANKKDKNKFSEQENKRAVKPIINLTSINLDTVMADEFNYPLIKDDFMRKAAIIILYSEFMEKLL